MLNTIAAVIVDRQGQAREHDQEYMLILQNEDIKESYNYLQELFTELDTDGDGQMDLRELLSFYDRKDEFKDILNRMDIHKCDLPIVFDIIDEDGSGDIKFLEFVSGIHSLKYDDAHTLQVFTKHFSESMYAKWSDVEETKALVTQIHRKLQDLSFAVDMLEEEREDCEENEATRKNGLSERGDTLSVRPREDELMDSQHIDGGLEKPGDDTWHTRQASQGSLSQGSLASSQCGSIVVPV